jgi:hypothetical protein
MSNQELVEEFITEAQRRFGKRTNLPGFSVEDVINGPQDATWDEGKNHVHIRISGWDDFHRKGQLAHESIHVWSPATNREATYLDEGLATFFAVDFCKYHKPQPPNQANYLEALDLVSRLIVAQPDCIKELTSTGTRIALLTESDILRVCTTCAPSDAERLLHKFYV